MYFYRPLKPLRALTFDLDDTLYDNQPVIARTEQILIQFLKKYHPKLYNLDKSNYHYLRYKLRQREPEIYHDVSYWRWRSIELAMLNVGLNKNQARIGANTAMDITLYWRNKINIPQETHYTLAALCNRWPLIAITNGNVSPKKCGLGDYFRYILRAGHDGRAKPWEDMYRLASEKLEVPPETILHVGDDLNTDINGAMRYGMQTCWINENNNNCTAFLCKKLLPNMEISRLISLTDLL